MKLKIKGKKIGYLVLVFFLIFTFTTVCKKNEALPPVENASAAETKPLDQVVDNSNYAYVTNPNGIALYQTALDLKSKIENIPVGGKIIFTNETINPQSDESNQWASVSFNGKKGYVYSVDLFAGKDWFTLYPFKTNNEKTNKEEEAFAIIQTNKAFLYELPSLDSKKVSEIDQFTMVSIVGSGAQYDPFISNNIDLEMGGPERSWYEISSGDKKGFILNSINYPVTKEQAEIQLKDKYISEKGYFALTAKEPIIYNYDTKEIFGKEYKIKVLKENAFLNTSESRVINGEQVYLITFADKISVIKKAKPKKSEEDTSPYMGYISAKDGMYFTEEKFSDYTVANTKFKGDMNAITIMRSEFEKRGIFLNYLNFSLRKISGDNFPKESYFIASAQVGNLDAYFSESSGLRSIILKQTDGIFEPVSSSIYTSRPILYKDLDGDKVKELIVKTPTRGGDETVIYGLKEGKYISLNSTLYQLGVSEIELKGDKIKGKKWITSEDGQTTKPEIHYFKYDHGNFIEVKK